MTESALSASQSATVTGLFDSADAAECAYGAALDLGYQQPDINLVMSDETRQRFLSSEAREDSDLRGKVAESTAGSSKLANELGGPAGGAMGTIAPVLAAVGTLVLIPGIAVAGPIAIALAAAGAVGFAGGLIGALSKWGIPEDRIHEYETGIRSGAILLGVDPRSKEDAGVLVRRWQACGGKLVHS